MFKKIGSIILLITISFSASADWIEFDRDQEFIYSTNPENWRIKDTYKQIVEIWVKQLIYKDLTRDGLTVGDYNIYKYSVNCTDEKVGLMTSVTYKNGNAISTEHASYVKYETTIPDSRGYMLTALVCKIVFNDSED